MLEKKQVKAVKNKDIKILISVISVLLFVIIGLVVLIILDSNGKLVPSSENVTIEPPKTVGEFLTEGDYDYYLLENGGAMIANFKGEPTETITVPSEIGGHKVRAIGELTFSSSEATYSVIKEIRLPEGVVYIGKGAFSGIENARIYLPSTIEQIDNMAFYGLENPEGIYFAGSKEEWKQVKIGSENKALAKIICEK